MHLTKIRIKQLLIVIDCWFSWMLLTLDVYISNDFICMINNNDNINSDDNDDDDYK